MTNLEAFTENGISVKTEEESFDDYCRKVDEFTINQWMPFWVKNAAENYHIVPKDPRELKTLSHLRNIAWGREAVVLASGPSLDEQWEHLKRFRGLVFAGNSTINPCLANGINPDWVHVLDADEYVPKQFEGIDTQGMKVILPTYIHPGVAKMFTPGLIWWINIFDHRHWFTNEGLHHLFPGVDGLFASSTCPSAMVRLAHWMGIRRTYVLGADFGFPGGRERCAVYHKTEGEWVKAGMDEFAIDRGARETINGIETTKKLRVAHRAFVDIVKSLDGLECFDCSNGIMTELPKLNFREVVDG